MKQKTVVILMTLLLLCVNIINSQTKKTPLIKIDINTEATATVLLFDQRFKFESFKTEYDSIHFNYEINPDDKKSWHYFNGDSFALRIKKSVGVAVFPEAIKPLHPNVPYQFNFIAFKKIELDDTEQTNLKTETFKLVKSRFANPKNVSNTTVSEFKADLKKIIRKYAKADDFYNSDGTLVNINLPLYESYLYPTIDKLGDLSIEINQRLEPNVLNTIERVFESIDEDASIISKIFTIVNGDIKPSEKLTNILASKVNASAVGNETLTMQDFGSFFFDDFDYNLKAVLKRNYKIVGTTLVPGSKLDKNSIILLESFLNKIVSKNITNDEKNAILTESEITQIKKIRADFSILLEKLMKIELKSAQIDKLSATIPNILNDTFIMDNISIEEAIYMDLTADKNAYIGIDLGLVYAFSLESMFIYEGTNFYFKPVNREALFSDLEGWDEFFKRFSAYIGVAQLITDKPDNFKPLFGKNSLLTGVGWRLNRTFRINTGALMHYEINSNPLIDTQKFKVSPTISLSVDLDIVKALGSVGKILNTTE
ncbi:hypothetical protein [Mariniflexile sp. AS56]|uniref:hypothetical protein n=1 Tax=Mariniflexile sp. AS56 TaxID=3063957 RepID=UPI0026EA3921|nr:hypothetical protein [Mariniflexile sp. AS56]MDO7171437.1 hypothetical protein [Mariniflexile sp. AS56]